MAVLEVTGREAADPIAAIELCYSQGWTDGLPVIPPTDERVATFLGHLKRGRDEVLGGVPERRRFVTVEHMAANAVMAGCLPEYAPVVVAAGVAGWCCWDKCGDGMCLWGAAAGATWAEPETGRRLDDAGSRHVQSGDLADHIGLGGENVYSHTTGRNCYRHCRGAYADQL